MVDEIQNLLLLCLLYPEIISDLLMLFEDQSEIFFLKLEDEIINKYKQICWIIYFSWIVTFILHSVLLGLYRKFKI